VRTLRKRAHHLNSRDFLLAFAAIVTGMALVFVILSSTKVSTKLLIGLLGLGTALTSLSLWRVASKKSAKQRHNGGNQ